MSKPLISTKEGSITPIYPKISNLKPRPDILILPFAPGNEGKLAYCEDEKDNDNYQQGDDAFICSCYAT